MGNNSELGNIVRAYFNGLGKGYSAQTLMVYKSKLEKEFGITDFKQLKTDFIKGKYSD